MLSLLFCLCFLLPHLLSLPLFFSLLCHVILDLLQIKVYTRAIKQNKSILVKTRRLGCLGSCLNFGRDGLNWEMTAEMLFFPLLLKHERAVTLMISVSIPTLNTAHNMLAAIESLEAEAASMSSPNHPIKYHSHSWTDKWEASHVWIVTYGNKEIKACDLGGLIRDGIILRIRNTFHGGKKNSKGKVERKRWQPTK